MDKNSKSLFRFWKKFTFIWNSLCIVATIATLLWQLSNYINGEDMTVVEYKKFNNKEIDRYPSFGLCLTNGLIERKLNAFGANVQAYGAFLAGMFWNEDMLLIDYNKVSLDFDDFIVSYGVMNNKWDEIPTYVSANVNDSTIVKKPGFKEFSLFGVKCFTIDIPFKKDQKLLNAYIVLKTEIFPLGIRPPFGNNPLLDNMFVVVPHYSKQFYTQVNVGQTKWPVRDINSSKSYMMEFNVRNVEIFERRNKYKEPCLEDVPPHDDQIQQWVLDKVGCKPPYWNSISEMALCTKFSEMEAAAQLIFSAVFGDLESANYTKTLPCRTLEKVQYDVRDIDLGHENVSTVRLIFNLREYTYKQVKEVRSMDLQALVGNQNLTYSNL